MTDIIRKPMEGFAIFFVYSILFSIFRISTTLDTITPTLSIRDGETLASAGGCFEMGFFSPGNPKNRYLGIWYKFSTSTVVWVANREVPLTDPLGVLTITDQGILVLVNGTNSTIVWSSTNTSRTAKNPVGQLLDSGNLVVKDDDNENPENFLWQSFDHPCDTILPGMKLGRNLVTGLDTFLSSWKSTEDPAPGNFTFVINLHGFPQMVLKNGPTIQFRIGSWDGNTFTGLSSLKPDPLFKIKFVLNEKEVYQKYESRNSSRFVRIVVRPSGIINVFVWLYKRNDWGLAVTEPQDQCDTYASCGAYGSCNTNHNTLCSCLEGFVPKSPKDWALLDSDGCIRKTPLACDNSDGFIKYARVKLPDTSTSWFNRTMSLKECEQQCLKNCSCVGYANLDIRGEGSGCLLWFDKLIDMKEFEDSGQDLLYIRVAASELGQTRHSIKRKQAGIIIVSSVTLVTTGVLMLGYVLYMRKKKLEKKGIRQTGHRMDYINEDGKEDFELPIFDLTIIANATDNFSTSNKLGKGGFGPVYKGTFIEGQEIAVKRLSINSRQGLKELKNEVILIAKLQHRNLVKLLGCCIQGEEKMLIYEFMPNKSLDFFIFDPARRKLIDWSKRVHIICGIARGLLYLHQDSRLTIIHRDLKASNVLLDKDMNPKISDFGLAKTFGLNQTSANTNRVVGTYGYMAPEYVMDGLISVKLDVFSFGVLVLEIVSGKKNRGFCHPDHQLNLLGHAWRLWIEERSLELMDESLGESCALSEILRCIHVGLLCVQQKPEDRPNMSYVVLMLGSEGLLPQPKQPGFYTERNGLEVDPSTSSYEPCSENKITLTLEAR